MVNRQLESLSCVCVSTALQASVQTPKTHRRTLSDPHCKILCFIGNLFSLVHSLSYNTEELQHSKAFTVCIQGTRIGSFLFTHSELS